MSGGSFNYLCDAARWGEIGMDRQSDIEQMLVAITRYGPDAIHAAAATAQVLAKLAEARMLAASLADVWRAVEWHQSCDWTEKQVHEALSTFNFVATTRWEPPLTTD